MDHGTETEQSEAYFQEKASNIQQRYFGELDSIKGDVKLSDAERLQRGRAAHERASRERAAAVRQHNAALEKREEVLRRKLFGAPVAHKDGVAVQSSAFTEALTRATLASEEDLRRLADVAAQTGDQALGKAVFVAAHQRGAPDLAHNYLKANPDAAASYRELASIPNAEQRSRAAESPEYPPIKFEQLRPDASDIQRAERAERMERLDSQDAHINR